MLQRSGRNPSSTTPQMCKSHESFGNRADKKEKMRHNHFIKTAQPYKPKVRVVRGAPWGLFQVAKGEETAGNPSATGV